MRSGGEIGGVHLAVGFKRRAAAQQADLLKILVAGVLALLRAEQLGLIDLKQRRGCVRAFKIAAQANELPSLPVNHGRVADAFEQVNAVHDRASTSLMLERNCDLRMRRVHLVIEAVEALPLLGRDFFAHLARVFARAHSRNRSRMRD